MQKILSVSTNKIYDWYEFTIDSYNDVNEKNLEKINSAKKDITSSINTNSKQTGAKNTSNKNTSNKNTSTSNTNGWNIGTTKQWTTIS